MTATGTDAVDQEFAQFRGQLSQFWLRQPAQISRNVDGLEEGVLAGWWFCHLPQFIPSRPGLVMAAAHVVESPQGRVPRGGRLRPAADLRSAQRVARQRISRHTRPALGVLSLRISEILSSWTPLFPMQSIKTRYCRTFRVPSR